jgi:hypothetical protein
MLPLPSTVCPLETVFERKPADEVEARASAKRCPEMQINYDDAQVRILCLESVNIWAFVS